MNKYDGFRWIKVQRHTFDPAKSWEENYRDLAEHHVAETSFLIEEVRKLAEALEKSRDIDG